jgi:hypothetical protein
LHRFVTYFETRTSGLEDLMQQFTVGIRSKDGEIQELTVNAESISRLRKGDSIYFQLEGQGPGNRVIISPEAFVFGGPTHMIEKK